MKKLLIVFGLLSLVVVGALNINVNNTYDYLRLHIRANSNSVVDQNVKYEVKDMITNFLTPYLANVNSKESAIDVVENLKPVLINKSQKILKDNGFNYSVNVKVNNEYFPARSYDNVTLDAGYYDAVIIELGEADGDNWWCVMYPPLCFVNKNQNTMQINFKSKIIEWFGSIFG